MEYEMNSSSGSDTSSKQRTSQEVEIDNSKAILKKIATLYAEKLMNDICLVVDGIEYPAHRLILCTSSDVFQVMLMNSQWCESQESRVVLQESPQCATIFPEFLRYFYTGQIRINQSTIMGLLTLADKYNVTDLITLCIEYMNHHVAEAAVHEQLITWYQYTLSLTHYQLPSQIKHRIFRERDPKCKSITQQWYDLRETCHNFIKWNFEMVVNTSDFGNFHPQILALLLQENDLVVHSEVALFEYIVNWIEIQREHLKEEINEADVDNQLFVYVHEVMSNIRFPMMNSRELASLLLSPLIMKYKEFFMEKMAVGAAFNKGQESAEIMRLQTSETGKLLFTPRLYTAEQWSSNLVINNFSSLVPYQPCTLMCTTPPTLRECLYEQTCEWVIDLYPKGLCFQRGFLIVWQGTVTIPEHVNRTVRLSITCRDPPITDKYLVKIGVLVSGLVCGIESVVEVVYDVYKFSQKDDTFIINNLLSYQKLNDSFNNLSPKLGENKDVPYLIGNDRDTLKLRIVMIPLCPVLSSIEERFNSSHKN